MDIRLPRWFERLTAVCVVGMACDFLALAIAHYWPSVQDITSLFILLSLIPTIIVILITPFLVVWEIWLLVTSRGKYS